MCRKRTYPINGPFVRPHREAIDMFRLEVAGDGRPDPGRDFIVCRSLVGHPARLKVPGRNAGTHLIHPQWPRHQREDSEMMDGREDESGEQALHA